MENQPIRGLTGEEASRLTAEGRVNRMPEDKEGGAGAILRRNLLTLFNLLNLAMAALLVWVGSYRNMLFLGVVVSNALIGTVQELRAKRTHDRLRLLSEGKVRTLRDGVETLLPPEELVEGDVTLLSRGDQVPADGLVLEGEGSVDESILTGESAAIPKKPGDTLYSGSFLTQGRLTLRLTAIGVHSYMGGLQMAARKVKRTKSVLMGDMRRIIRGVSFAVVPMGLLMYWKQRAGLGLDNADAVVRSVGAMIGMIPEGLMLLTSVSLAAGVVALGRKHTLVNELYGIESLARVNVLCMDKTGTLTSGRMSLERCVAAPGVTETEIGDCVSALLTALGAEGQTAEALSKAYVPGTTGDESNGPSARPGRETLERIPFSSERKWSLARFADLGSVCMGAPERLLDGEALAQAKALAAQGMRVVALARSAEAPVWTDGQPTLPAQRKLLCLFCLADALRPQVRETVRYFGEQGVCLKVLSGDSPLTVSFAAVSAGLPGGERYVDLSQLEGERDYLALSRAYTVFGRVSPEDKRELIRAMQRDGDNVAMVGDGVNDIPALKTADCSIAMAGGSDAACRVAQMTLLGGGFDAMPQILLEGRRVINNVTRTSALFLVKNIYSLLLSLLLLALPFAYPFAPIQLTLVSTLTIGAPSLVLALQPSKERVKGNFLRNVVARALPGGVCVALLTLTMMLLQGALGLSREEVSAMCTLLAGFCGLTVLTLTCLPLNRLRAGIVACMTLCMTGAVLLLPKVFFLTPLPGRAWAVLAALCALNVPIQLALGALVSRAGTRRAQGTAGGLATYDP